MGAEKFIEGKKDDKNHAGRHSLRMRLDAAKAEFFAYLDGKTSKPPRNPFLPPEVEEGGLVDPYMPEGEGTEIVLFQAQIRPSYQVYELGGKADREGAEADATYNPDGTRFT